MEYLKTVFGDSASEILSALGSVQTQLEKFTICLDSSTAEEIKFEAHRLRSELMICGFETLSDLMLQIETAAFNNGLLSELKVKYLKEVACVHSSINQLKLQISRTI